MLRVPRVSVTDNFFSLGGHSLLATQVISRVRKGLGVELPLRALFEAPSVESLAALLQRAQQAAQPPPQAAPAAPATPVQPVAAPAPKADVGPWSPLLTLREGDGAHGPLYIVHPVDGGARCYAELAAQVPATWSVVGIQARGLEDGRAPLESVEAMAALYVEALRNARPQGPYLLAGWAMGGVVAWEMAQQLQRDGQDVDLVLVEPGPATPDRGTAANAAAAQAALFARELAALAGVEPLALPQQLTTGKDAEPLLQHLLTEGPKAGLLPGDSSLAELRTRFKVFAGHLRASRRYLPEPYAGKVRMLRAAEAPDLDEDVRDRGWGELAEGGLEVSETPGSAYSLLRAPHVAELVKRLLGVDGTEPPSTPGGGGGGSLPLSFAQQRLWFIDQLTPGSPAYNISAALRLNGPLRHDVLERAFTELVRRHQALRTAFQQTPDGPEQVISEPGPFPVPMEDLRSVPSVNRDAELRRHLEGEARRPFNLATGPLLRARLLRLGEQDHVLVLVIHHIVSDAWSMGILVREVTALYAAFMLGQPSPLTELAVQYGDYARWQRGWLKGEVLERQLGYWRKQLEDAPAALELPTDLPRPAMQSFRGATLPVDLSRPVSDAVRALCAREGTTAFMVLLAGFQALLSRYSGQDDVVVGSAIAGRNRAEYEELIGFFVNTLALRTRFAPGLTFRQLLSRVKETTLDAYAHQDLPFEKLVEVLQPHRDLGRPPFFQVLFTLQNTRDEGASVSSSGFSIRPLEIETGVSRMDLTLSLADTPQGFRGGLEYDTDLFEPSTAARLVRHLHMLMEGFVAAPDRPLAEVSLLSLEERRQVLGDWNATATDYPRDTPIHTLFSRQAALTPDAVAVVFGDSKLTYRALDRRANQLAHHLRTVGVAPGARVGVCLERSLELVVALLGILKAGGAYLPVDRAWPAERITLLLRQAGVDVMLTHDPVANGLPAVGPRLVRLDSEWTQVSRQPETEPGVDVSAMHLAYVMFTSGSTGQPKGVCVPHRGVVRLVRGSTFADFGPEHTFIQTAPMAFDASTLEVWGPLLNGGRLVVAPPHKFSLEELDALLVSHGVTTLWMTTALFAQAVLYGGELLTRVRQVLAGGEVMPEARMRQHLERMGEGAVFVHAYGPTENTTFSTTHTLRRGDAPGGSVPIGRPLSNSTTYVLGEGMRPVPVGVPGELYVGGDGLAWGYLGRPELTAERFVPDPFGTMPGSRLYQTGDRVRWRSDGTLDFLGRTDFQVKVRGFRIEPGEVEAVVRQLEGVREAAVVVREDTPGDKRLVAYVVGEAGQPLEASAVKAFLQRKLPEYLLPSAVVPLPALPLSPNGKVDRKALPAPEAPSGGEHAEYLAPRTETERQLAVFFSALLRVERVGAHDGFFELGGHSLLATQLVSRVRAAFGVDLPLRDLFEAPTVAELAERLEQARRAGEGLQAPPLTPVPRTGPLPLSFAQQRLWFLDRLEPGSSFYNIPSAIRLDGALEVGALERSLQELVRRHEALRTTFHVHEDSPVQTAHAEATLPLPVVDLGNLPEAEHEARVRKLALAEASKPFDLTRAPLLRTTLLRLSERRHVLLFTVHHVVADGWSIGVLIREVGALYSAFSKGLPSPLEPLTLQYADYAAWQRGWLRDEVLETQVAWWRKQLAGLPHAVELPTDRPRPPAQTFRGATVPVRISGEQALELQAMCRHEGVTPFMALLSAFHVLLSRYSGQDDLVIGSPIANRRQAELEGIVGFFVNTLALRARLKMGMTFRELLAQVRETTLGAYTHQDVPFEKLVEALHVTRDASRNPLFQVLFALQNTPAPVVQRTELTVSPLDVDVLSIRFDLELNLSEAPQGYQGTLGYNTDLFEPDTARRMAEHFHLLVQRVVARPDAPLGSLPLLADVERQQLLVEWNATASEYPRTSTLPEVFSRVVARHADKVAVEFAGELGSPKLTYRQLDARSNQLAHHLRRLGVRTDSRVALAVDRSLELIVSLLAILKAGGAYVPLDSSYPRERLAAMLEDSCPRVLVTTRALMAKLPVDNLATVVLDDVALATESELAPPPAALPESLAYIDFTSGSTGRPKGVGTTQASVLRTVLGVDYAHLGPDETFLLIAPISFDASTLEVWGPLLHGARLVVFPPHSPSDVLELETVLTKHGVTTLHLTSGLFTQVVDHHLGALHGVRQLLTGGDVVSAPHVRRVLEELRIPVTACYGPTEGTLFTSCHRMTDGAHVGTSVPIGKPIGNTQVYVLDASGQPVPSGVTGELFIGGDGLARGYVEQPALTAERFVPNPFSSSPGARLYRTGDLARWRRDGVLEFLGRADAQVKVRGYRIELAEIEAALLSHPAVREAVVLAREDRPGDKRLVGYVVASPAGAAATPEGSTPRGAAAVPTASSSRTSDGDSSTSPTALRSFLTQRLPEYMVPSAIVLLAALPLTANAKVDRKALPAPEATGALDVTSTYVAPRDALEETLANIWEELLGVSPIGVTSDFFELGGHSLLAVRLMARIRERTGHTLPMSALFQGATVEHLATRVRQNTPPAAPVVTLQPGEAGRRPLFLVHPVGGTVFCYAELARRLGLQQPVHGLESPPPDEAPTSMEALAAWHLRNLQQLQPTGPYFLGGWSLGGVVALEMARQLQARGERVELLALVDPSPVTPTPDSRAPTPEEAVHAAVHFAMDLARVSGVPLALPDTLPEGATPEAVLELLLAGSLQAGGSLPVEDLPTLKARFATFRNNTEALRGYAVRTYTGPALLVRAAHSEDAKTDRGWGTVLPHITPLALPGDHYSLLQAPHVTGLAQILVTVLSEATKDPGA